MKNLILTAALLLSACTAQPQVYSVGYQVASDTSDTGAPPEVWEHIPAYVVDSVDYYYGDQGSGEGFFLMRLKSDGIDEPCGSGSAGNLAWFGPDWAEGVCDLTVFHEDDGDIREAVFEITQDFPFFVRTDDWWVYTAFAERTDSLHWEVDFGSPYVSEEDFNRGVKE